MLYGSRHVGSAEAGASGLGPSTSGNETYDTINKTLELINPKPYIKQAPNPKSSIHSMTYFGTLARASWNVGRAIQPEEEGVRLPKNNMRVTVQA